MHGSSSFSTSTTAEFTGAAARIAAPNSAAVYNGPRATDGFAEISVPCIALDRTACESVRTACSTSPQTPPTESRRSIPLTPLAPAAAVETIPAPHPSPAPPPSSPPESAATTTSHEQTFPADPPARAAFPSRAADQPEDSLNSFRISCRQLNPFEPIPKSVQPHHTHQIVLPATKRPPCDSPHCVP